jgi:DNA-binding CsgD family transcriptional regulator
MNHGTESGYTQHRKAGVPVCEPCRDAHREYTRAYRARQARPALRVSPQQARRHIIRLVEQGCPLYVIADQAGVNQRTVADIAADGRAFIYRHTEQAILAVDGGHGHIIPAIGTHRRIQALMAIGYPFADIAKRLGVHHDRIRQYLIQEAIYTRTAARIARMYDELSMTPGPSRRARSIAARRGYLPPLAWDDDTIDDPAAWASPGEDDDDMPDPVVVERLASGADWKALGANRAERLDAAALMLRRGIPAAEIERHLSLRGGRDFGRVAA